jgi:hypothetical protein
MLSELLMLSIRSMAVMFHGSAILGFRISEGRCFLAKRMATKELGDIRESCAKNCVWGILRVRDRGR